MCGIRNQLRDGAISQVGTSKLRRWEYARLDHMFNYVQVIVDGSGMHVSAI